jgi:predicted PurR-regulated permease PerM
LSYINCKSAGQSGTNRTTQAEISNLLRRSYPGRVIAVLLSLLFWAWIWGAVGLVLAVPIVGAAKIVCDYTDSLKGLGIWLGE